MKQILPTIILALLAAASCTERIDILTGTQSPKLVISAYISSEPSRQSVWISKTVPYFGGAEAQGVDNAQVFIDDVALTHSDSVAGEYHTADNFFVSEGQSCTLRVLYDLDGDGTLDVFTATEIMPHNVTLDSLVLFKIGLDTGRYVPPFMIATRFTRNLADECFAFDMYYGDRDMIRTLGNYRADATPYGMFDTEVVYALNVSGTITMGEGDTLRLCPFDTLNIRLNSIPRSMLDFLQAAQQELRGGDPMFSGPPANIPTNIAGNGVVGNGVVGCFALRNMSNWKSVALPMNVRSLNGMWVAQDGSGRRLSINDGVAVSNGVTYFSNVRVDAAIRGFAADMAGGGVSWFKMENYNEFVDMLSSASGGWKRESWRVN
jgi:hypothetical protein